MNAKSANRRSGGPPSTVFVYGLVDPECRELFYVGCTVDPVRRLCEHRNGPHQENGPWMEAYLLRMKNRGYLPEMVILEQSVERASKRDRERAWIEFFQPMILFNMRQVWHPQFESAQQIPRGYLVATPARHYESNHD
jgi:hypothetical protein